MCLKDTFDIFVFLHTQVYIIKSICLYPQNLVILVLLPIYFQLNNDPCSTAVTMMREKNIKQVFVLCPIPFPTKMTNRCTN